MMNMMHGAPYVLSGTGDWDSMADMMREMMWPYQAGLGRSFWGAHWIFELLTWVSLIAVLIALTRYLWKKGDKVK
jgi:hypothetical protein